MRSFVLTFLILASASALAAPTSKLDLRTAVACFTAMDAVQGNTGWLWGGVAIDGEARIGGANREGSYVFKPNGQVAFFRDHDSMEFLTYDGDESDPGLHIQWSEGTSGVLTPRTRGLLADELYTLLQETRTGSRAVTVTASATTPAATPVAATPAPQPRLNDHELRLAAMIEMQGLLSIPLPTDNQSESLTILMQYFTSLGPTESSSIEAAVARLTSAERASLVRRKLESAGMGPSSSMVTNRWAPSQIVGDLAAQVQEITQQLPDTAADVEITASPEQIAAAVEICNRVKGDRRIERFIDEWLAELPATGTRPASVPTPAPAAGAQ